MGTDFFDQNKTYAETKKYTASPDGVITNHKKLREFINSMEVKDEAVNKAHDLSLSPLGNQVSKVT